VTDLRPAAEARRLYDFRAGATAIASVLVVAACSGSSTSGKRQGPDGGTGSGGRQITNVDGSSTGAAPLGSGGSITGGGCGGRAMLSTGGTSFGSGGTGLGTGGTGTGTGGIGFGTGGAGPSGSPNLGAHCLMDAECGGGLVCLASDSNALGGGGPPGGLCTLACAVDTDCQAVDPNSLCVAFDAANQSKYCLQGCTQGAPISSKCRGRADMVCSSLVDQNGQPTVSACQPSCASDWGCAGRKCDFRTGLCMDALSGTLPIGSPCDPTASTDPCNGVCVNFYDSQDAALSQYGACFGSCSLTADGVGCGVDATSPLPFDAECLGPATAAAGDPGLCFQLCDCNCDCLNAAFVCRPWSDTQSADATGRKGYCRGPVDNMGVPVANLPCATAP
jgi:hypothetical protein